MLLIVCTLIRRFWLSCYYFMCRSKVAWNSQRKVWEKSENSESDLKSEGVVSLNSIRAEKWESGHPKHGNSIIFVKVQSNPAY